MKRRTFIKTTSLTALSISAFGAIEFDGKSYVGTTPTTSDILGPFYRPNAPVRSNLIVPGSKGVPTILKGTIYKEDGTTPLENALVEIWHCSEDQVYDNSSDEYNYRGAQTTKKNGKYEFRTIMPVPYKANPNNEDSWRPAHIHMRVSIPNQQDLVTQIYFKGGKYNDTDTWAAGPDAINRTLEIKKKGSENEIQFDVILNKEIPLDASAYQRITGLYKMSDGSMNEFVKSDDMLMMRRNGQYMVSLNYIGNNTFESKGMVLKMTFELQSDGTNKVVAHAGDETFTGTKFMKY